MKPLLAASACFITATLVCARIGTDEGPASDEATPPAEPTQHRYVERALSDFHPPASAYGIVGAAALAVIIAARRAGEHGQA